MQEMPLDEFIDRYDAGPLVVVDVREPAEYHGGHVPGALSMPLSQLSGRVQEIPAAETVYVICASGNRSRAGADVIEAAGRRAWSIIGGTQSWDRAGRPLAHGSN